jgi:predicted transcriptional regulator
MNNVQEVAMARSITKVVTAHLPEELAERLDGFAEDTERSRGWIMKEALQSYLDWEDEKDRLTVEALERAEQVGFIPHDEIVEWARSLSSDSPLPEPKARKI